MKGRLRTCSSYQRELLSDGWEMGLAEPAAAGAGSPAAWLPAVVPGTVAHGLRELGQWSFDAPTRRFDAEEWWYRRRFTAPQVAPGERLILGFDGLATLAEVWLNGRLLARSSNMFQAHELDVTGYIEPTNELIIRFGALDDFLAAKRPRPRWRTPMVAHQQLRWVRTSLLGRTPGWSPPAPPIGPWRPVWLECRACVDFEDLQVAAVLDGTRGIMRVSGRVAFLGERSLESASIAVSRNGHTYHAPLDCAAGLLQGVVEIPTVDLWWPHTHGEPVLYEAGLRFVVNAANGTREIVDVSLGRVGFRTITLDRELGDFSLTINGVRVFCRGAVWTPLDCVSLNATASDYIRAMDQVRAAGMNMLRVAGPFVYESDMFLDQCDAAGILLWQDFMFANMDYPASDPEFAAGVNGEAAQLLGRLQARPSLSVLCGNSEVYQQAAMSGAAREQWTSELFETTLAAHCREYCPDVPYCPSSTHGGDLPFSPNQGVSSYYGVGAYLLPVTDARRSEVRFASECLAFANIPENETLAPPDGPALHFNQARWKERTPRDLGAGWDFDDVRDRYLQKLFRVEVPTLRYSDQERYMRLSRATSGEVMAAAFAEWRRARSLCRGALILFLRDLWPGAGWGLIDCQGRPKAAYYYLKRTLGDLAIFITDEGSNGLMMHVANDCQEPARGQLQVELYRLSQPVGRPVSRSVVVEPRAIFEINPVRLFEGFLDLSYSYRFGPPSYDVMRAAFIRDDGTCVDAFHFPLGLPNSQGEVGIAATAKTVDGGVEVEIETSGFAQGVHIEARGYVAEDQYFHLAPRSRRTIKLTAASSAVSDPFEATVHALNSLAVRRIGLSS
jgi:beta-mannosidase